MRYRTDGFGVNRPPAQVLIEAVGGKHVHKEILTRLAENIMGEPRVAFNPHQVKSAREVEWILAATW